MSNTLPLAIKKILTMTGWSEAELLVYSTLIEKGALNHSNITREANLSSSKVQYALKGLQKKNVIQRIHKNNKPLYSVTKISQLKKWTTDFLDQYKHFNETLEEFIKKYDFNPEMLTPKVRFYEGHNGVKQSYRDIVKDCNEGGEIMAFFSVIEEVGIDLQNFFLSEYVPSRIKKKIQMNNIASISPKAMDYKKTDKKDLRETRLISRADFPPLNTEINIYGNYMHCMSFDNKSAFALIIEDEQFVSILKAIFKLVWKNEGLYYMADEISVFKDTIQTRKLLYPNDLKEKWRNAKPKLTTTHEGEVLMHVLGHEVMASYQQPYMKTLAEIVTRNGGKILNVGYGLGIVDEEIERYRKERKLDEHYVIELNKHCAKEAKKKEGLKVIEGDWKDILENMKGIQFNGILYDGYPLSLEEMHRDGILFIDQVVKKNILSANGILTLYVDAPDSLGVQFKEFLKNLNLKITEVKKIEVTPPKRTRQIWKKNHFLALAIQYSDKIIK